VHFNWSARKAALSLGRFKTLNGIYRENNLHNWNGATSGAAVEVRLLNTDGNVLSEV
jgi:hypothetical protein